MRTIWKYPLDLSDRTELMIPKGGEVLAAQIQELQPCLWILVDSDAEIEVRTFDSYGTGYPLPEISPTNNRKYIATIQQSRGCLAPHISANFLHSEN